jgi:L-ornithine N5-oxygenase
MYLQRVENPDETQWQQRILAETKVARIEHQARCDHQRIDIQHFLAFALILDRLDVDAHAA